jgi:hypothetical protein
VIHLFLFSGWMSGDIPQEEREALIQLYNETGGDNWTENTGWKAEPLHTDGFAAPGAENTWFGITCDSENTTVMKIILAANNLTGTIPTSLANLPNLQELSLIDNALSGQIPPGLGKLENVTIIYLSNNQLAGPIPAELGNLAKLTSLFLLQNQLTGIIPPELGKLSNLEYLLLYDNQLTGNIPVEITQLTNLKKLNLGDNQLDGTIPPGLGGLSQLTVLTLRNNQLTGNIPPELENLKNLEHLYLQDNQLTGGILPWLGNLSKLTILRLNSNALTGIIPGTLKNLGELTTLDIGYNALHTQNAELRAFLNDKQPGWDSTQTIAPTGLKAEIATGTSIKLTWETIKYTGDPGRYRVFHGTSAGGPYTQYGITTDKKVSQMELTGLQPGTTYYLAVRTRTLAHDNNQNIVNSELSSEVSAHIKAIINVTSPRGNDVYSTRNVIDIRWKTLGVSGNVDIRMVRTDKPGEHIIKTGHPYDGSPVQYTVAEDVLKGIYYIEVRQGEDFGRTGKFYIAAETKIN